MSSAVSTPAPPRPRPRPRPRTVLVTGANGYIGSAVSRAFGRAGWQVYGLIRRPEVANGLVLAEVTPVVGTFDDPKWLHGFCREAPTVDVIVNCLDFFPDYEGQYEKFIGVIRQIAVVSNRNGVRPLLFFTTGCKDYGFTPLHGDPALKPQIEETPLNPPVPPIKQRAEVSLRVYENKDLFDATILYPTSVVGYSSSYYASVLDYAAEQAAKGEPALRIAVDPNVPMHALHVDDCAEAYVALAEHMDRAAISGQAFNISGYRYETAGEVGAALAAAYGFAEGVKFVKPEEAGDWFPFSVRFVLNFPQWVGSDKIRRLTGWSDKKRLFSENMAAYRAAYEAEQERANENIDQIRARIKTIGDAVTGKV